MGVVPYDCPSGVKYPDWVQFTGVAPVGTNRIPCSQSLVCPHREDPKILPGDLIVLVWKEYWEFIVVADLYPGGFVTTDPLKYDWYPGCRIMRAEEAMSPEMISSITAANKEAEKVVAEETDDDYEGTIGSDDNDVPVPEKIKPPKRR